MKFLAGIVFIGLALSSCTAGNKTTSVKGGDNTGRKKMACADIHVDMNTPHLDWFREHTSVLNKADQVLVLPKDYEVYSIDSARLADVFSIINKGDKVATVIPLPQPAGCQLFTLHNNVPEGTYIRTGATPAAGEAKGQQIIASYYNGQLSANINWFDIKFEIKPVTVQGKPYFIVYTQQPPAENKNLDKSINTTPELQEIRYDK